MGRGLEAPLPLEEAGEDDALGHRERRHQRGEGSHLPGVLEEGSPPEADPLAKRVLAKPGVGRAQLAQEDRPEAGRALASLRPAERQVLAHDGDELVAVGTEPPLLAGVLERGEREAAGPLERAREVLEEEERALARREARGALGVRRDFEVRRRCHTEERRQDLHGEDLVALRAVAGAPLPARPFELDDHRQVAARGQLPQALRSVGQMGPGRRRPGEQRGSEGEEPEPEPGAGRPVRPGPCLHSFVSSSRGSRRPRKSGSVPGPMLFRKTVPQSSVSKRGHDSGSPRTASAKHRKQVGLNFSSGIW